MEAYYNSQKIFTTLKQLFPVPTVLFLVSIASFFIYVQLVLALWADWHWFSLLSTV